MTSQTDNPQDSGKAKTETILNLGDDVRKQVSEAVTAGADQLQRGQRGLIALARSVMDGATAALDKAAPQDPGSVLRQVIDGLGDGLSTAALATRLAFEEAKEKEKSFAKEDLSKMTSELRAVGDQFVETVLQTAKKYRSMTGEELSALRTHAEQTMKRLIPSINLTLATIAEHPLKMGKESFETGVKLSTQALGSLFAAVGRRMEDAGKRLTGDSSAK